MKAKSEVQKPTYEHSQSDWNTFLSRDKTRTIVGVAIQRTNDSSSQRKWLEQPERKNIPTTVRDAIDAWFRQQNLQKANPT